MRASTVGIAALFALLPAAAVGGALALPVLLCLAGALALRPSVIRQVLEKKARPLWAVIAFLVWAAGSSLWSAYPGHAQALKLVTLAPLGLMFAAASLSAQVLLRRYFRALIARNPRHGWMFWLWIAIYAFVGIQMAWVLRPFIGSPDAPVTFFREGAWSNAYVAVLRIVWSAASGE